MLNSSTCFGAYYSIVREDFIVCPKLLIHCLITDLKLYYRWVYNSVYRSRVVFGFEPF